MLYTYEQAIEESTKYFNGNDLSAKVFVDKYALRNKEGDILESNPEQMHRRLAREFARIEQDKFSNPLSEDIIFSYLDRFKYIIPQGSPMYGIGNTHQIVSLSNCYVVDLYDSYGGICLTDQYITQISKRRGGIGYDISCLRPKDLPVSNAARTTTGAVSFMHRFSNTGREVGQCIEQNQRVLTSNGLKKIKDINPTEMVWTKDGWVQVVNTFNNGKKKVYKVTTDTGYSIISSIDHIYQTFNNQGKLTEIPLSKLEAGDKIVLCVGEGSHHSNYIKLEDPKYKNFNRKPANCILPEILDEKLAYILGYSYGDGYVEHDEYGEYGICLACSNDYPDIKEQLLSYIYNVFGYTSNLGAGDGDLERLRISNKTIVQFLKHNCLLKEKSGTISFPSKIIDSTISVQTAFIAGYFDADGYNGGKKTGYVFSSINKLFLKNIQILLSTYGILSKISSLDRSDEGWNTLYKLCVVGNASTSRFVDLFKTASVKVGLEQYISKRECWLTPFKPRSFDVKYNNHSFCPDNTQFLSLSVVNKLKSEYNTVTTLVQDNISSIEYIGEEDTYDLQLESEHLFWCEGFYVHNSGRRAAQMITISVHHPDIMDFITIKNDEISVTGANISVRLSDEFLNAVKSNEEYQLRWPVDVDNPQITRMVSARDVWKLIIHNAWLRAEPGLLMWDSIIRESPADCYSEFGFKTISTNPCSEIPLSAFDSCRLLALNLFNFIKNPFSKNAEYDFNLFKKYAGIAQRLMDDIVDLELECINKIITKIQNDPEPELVKMAELTLWKNIKTACENGRRTGTGITALGDTLAGMGIKYGSKNSVEFVDQLFKTLKLGSYRSSVDMAKELGSFPIWNHSLEKNNPFLLRIKDDDEELWSDMKKYGRRNIACLTSAPTGTISTQACLFVDDKYYFNTSSGIEPVFTDKPYIRRKKINHSDKSAKIDYIDKLGDKWSEFNIYHSGITAWMEVNEKDSENDSPYSGATAEEINWQNRVKLQAAAQQHIDHAISSTINLPNDVEEKEVAKIYETAWQSGCKGITVYRDGCRSGVLVKESGPKIVKTVAPERPKDLTCDVFHVTVKGKPYFVLVGLFEDGSPYEVFAGKNGHIDPKVKTGIITRKLKPKCYKAVLEDDTEISPVTIACDENEEALTRMVSTALRHGAETKFIVEQLTKVNGDLNIFAKALARALKHYIADGDTSSEKCPECECELVYQEGCRICKNCSFSKC